MSVTTSPSVVVPRLDAAVAADAQGIASPRPPVRIVHLGLGAFHRAHQLWFTALADPEGRWGTASFTGRSPRAARTVAEQDGFFTIVERSPDDEVRRLIGHLVKAHDGADVDALGRLLERPEVVIVTLTVTEAGFRLDAEGRLDTDDADVASDLDRWRDAGETAPALSTAVARLAYGLDRRRRAGAPALAVVPCDNIPDNGDVVERAVHGFAAAAAPELGDWIARNVSFVSTVVDRITPATTPEDVSALRDAVGYEDRAMVVTEPFAEWTLAGDFPGGRPRWEDAGARFVDDVSAFERRKLWMLNGAHTLLATTARHRGHGTVAAAFADADVREHVERYWDAVAAVLTDPALDLPAYRRALAARFANARIEHRLDQIAAETVTKLRIRAVAVIRRWGAEEAPEALLRPIAGWIATVVHGRPDTDASAAAVADAARSADPVPALLAVVDGELAGIPPFVERVRALVETFTPGRPDGAATAAHQGGRP